MSNTFVALIGATTMTLQGALSTKGNVKIAQRTITNAYKKEHNESPANKCGVCYEYDGVIYLRVVYLNGFANGYGASSPYAYTWIRAEDVVSYKLYDKHDNFVCYAVVPV